MFFWSGINLLKTIPWTLPQLMIPKTLVITESLQNPICDKACRFSSCTWLQKPGSIFFFFRVSKQGPYFTAIEEDGGDKRFVRLEFAWEAESVA